MLVVNNSPANAGDVRLRFDPWVGKIPWRRAWQPTSVFLPGRIPWTEEPGGLQSIGVKRAGRDWSDLACTCYFNMHGTCLFWSQWQSYKENICNLLYFIQIKLFIEHFIFLLPFFNSFSLEPYGPELWWTLKFGSNVSFRIYIKYINVWEEDIFIKRIN